MRSRLTFFALSLLLAATGCVTAPLYRGEGLRCVGGRWSAGASVARGPVSSEDNTLMREIESWMGTPYRYGGTSRSGVDCSGFTQAVFRAVGIELPRTASRQAAAAVKVRPENLKFGDLLFFTIDGSGIDHVGIYTGNGFFAHASFTRGVVKDSMSKEYWATRIASAGRFK